MELQIGSIEHMLLAPTAKLLTGSINVHFSYWHGDLPDDVAYPFLHLNVAVIV